MRKETTILKKLLSILVSNTPNILWALLSILYISLLKPTDQVVFLNVGQGDATLIQQGEFQILVDGGEGLETVYELSKYMKYDDRKIEIVILTHPHADHLDGLLEIHDKYEIGEVWLYPVCYDNPNYELLLSLDLEFKEIYSGMSFSIKDVYIDILWPRVSERMKCVVGERKSWDGNINNDSVVLVIEYLNKTFLLMGDAELPVEKEIQVEKDIDFLKAGHHCSKTSSGETFIKRIKPTYTICSCGEGNKFGHPDSGTLKTFSSLNVQYFVTHMDGNITVR